MNSSVYCSHGGGLDGYRALPLINSDCGERDKERLASPIIAEDHTSLPFFFLFHIPKKRKIHVSLQNSLPRLQRTTTREFVIIK